MKAVIPFEGENLMYLLLKFENDVKGKALIYTGACANAMPADFYEKLREASTNSLSELQPASFVNVKVASERNLKVLGQIEVQFKINEHKFADTFLILPSMNCVVLGNPFFGKQSIEISPGDNILKLPEMTYELNEIKTPSEGRKMVPKRRYPVVMSQKVNIKAQHEEILKTKVDFMKIIKGHTGLIIPEEDLENGTELRLSSSVVTVGKDKTISILAIHLNEHAITFTRNKQVAVFQFLSPQEEAELFEIGTDILALDKMKNGEIFRKINQPMRVGKTRGGRQPKRPPPEYDKI